MYPILRHHHPKKRKRLRQLVNQFSEFNENVEDELLSNLHNQKDSDVKTMRTKLLPRDGGDGDGGELSYKSKSLHKFRWLIISIFLSLLFVFQFECTNGFVIISDQDTPEGWILFDAHVPKVQHDNPSKSLKAYQYRISHHKTQPWVHRLVKVDKDGLVQLKKSISNCHFSGIYPSTFLVY